MSKFVLIKVTGWLTYEIDRYYMTYTSIHKFIVTDVIKQPDELTTVIVQFFKKVNKKCKVTA